MQNLKYIFVAIAASISLVFSLKCHHCGRVTPDRCEKLLNVPTRECAEPSKEEMESDGAKSVCIISSYKIDNQTFYNRMCGIASTANDTCSYIGERYAEFQFECYTCNEDFCNYGDGRSVSSRMDIKYVMLLIPGIYKLFLN